MYNPTAREMTEYMPVVQAVVARFLGRLPANVLREDLIAAGTFGLVGALGKNPEDQRGPSFPRYAHIRVRSAILDELRAQDWLSRRARKSVVRTNGSDNSTAILPFDETSAAENPTPDEQLAAEQDRAALSRAIDELPERERLIVRMHYFGDVQLKTIAKELGISAPRVTQLHARAMARIRERVAA